MKKLVLKKDIVARINGGEMNQLRGGCGPDGFCNQYTMPPADTPVTGIRLVRVNKLALKVAWIYVTFYAIRQPFTMQVIPALECALLVLLVGLTSY